MGKFCNSCKWWEGGIITRANQQFGVCHHPIASTCVIMDLETRITEENIVYTSSSFGCVYCESGNKVLIDINKILKK